VLLERATEQDAGEALALVVAQLSQLYLDGIGAEVLLQISFVEGRRGKEAQARFVLLAQPHGRGQKKLANAARPNSAQTLTARPVRVISLMLTDS